MAKNQTREGLTQHKDNALKVLDTYLEKLINDPDKKVNAKADKLSYWIEDWTTFLDFEGCFSPSSLKRYKRGEIIKVHLGYNIGSEEGGLHYAVIVEKDNSIYNPVVTIVPLTSIKENKDLSNLRKGEVLIGNELFLKFSKKITDTFHSTDKEQIGFLEKMNFEISKMKHGSIALVNQITTISKIRIYDPKKSKDMLSGITLSEESLDKIDCEIIKRFTK